jgi:hypothetical protein
MIAPAQPHVFTNVDWNRVPAPSSECVCGMPLVGREKLCPQCAGFVQRAQAGAYAAVIRLRRILAAV